MSPDPARRAGERWLIFLLGCAILTTLASGWLLYQRWPPATSVVIHPPPAITDTLLSAPTFTPAFTLASQPSVASITVMINGAVQKPGSYVLQAGATISDALHAAGGSTAGAALGQLDLSQLLVDGALITIPELNR